MDEKTCSDGATCEPESNRLVRNEHDLLGVSSSSGALSFSGSKMPSLDRIKWCPLPFSEAVCKGFTSHVRRREKHRSSRFKSESSFSLHTASHTKSHSERYFSNEVQRSEMTHMGCIPVNATWYHMGPCVLRAADHLCAPRLISSCDLRSEEINSQRMCGSFCLRYSQGKLFALPDQTVVFGFSQTVWKGSLVVSRRSASAKAQRLSR